MKKLSLFLLMVCSAVYVSAASFGILVNGKIYYAGTLNATPGDPSFTEYMVLGVSLNAGDLCQLYDADNKAAWVVALDTYSTSDITLGNGSYVIGKTACYDFYIKLKYGEDQLYVGGNASCSGIKGTDISGGGSDPVDPTPDPTTAAPAQCPDVMFQAFHWDSWNTQEENVKLYGRTKWVDFINGSNGTSAEEVGQWFDLVWLPPMSRGTGGTGYLPSCYSDLGSTNGTDWGTKKKLDEFITTLRQNGARVVADIVINHAVAQNGWCDFGTYNFGSYGKFSPDASWICKTDEMNTDSGAGDCKGKATGAADDGYGSEANYEAGRDWDHTNSKVQEMFKAYLKWLRNEIKIDGFRYDYCKGFHNSHIADYNSAAAAYFSVMEYWDGDVNALQYHLNDAKWNTLTFDFATKYTAFNNGIAANNYASLKGCGLLGAGKSRYAVTFLDSHDSFMRDDNEFCGKGNSMKYPGKVQQCYAFILSMPGVPCVFFPHWVKFKEQLKPMINARYKTGVHSESAVSDEAGSGYYKATITGTNGQIRLLIGPNSGYASTPSGFTKAVVGENYGVYYKTNSPRGDKNLERVNRATAIEDVQTNQPKEMEGRKIIRDGKLLIIYRDQLFDAMGNRIQ